MSATERLRKACDGCHRRKQKCSLATAGIASRIPPEPCSRCIRIGIHCEFSPPVKRRKLHEGEIGTAEEFYPYPHDDSYQTTYGTGELDNQAHLLNHQDSIHSGSKSQSDLPNSEFGAFAASSPPHAPSSSSSHAIISSNHRISSNYGPYLNHQLEGGTKDFRSSHSSAHSIGVAFGHPPISTNQIEPAPEHENSSNLDFSDPQTLESWLRELGVSGIPDHISEEMTESFLDLAMPTEKQGREQAGASSREEASSNPSTEISANVQEGAIMRVDSLLSQSSSSSSLPLDGSPNTSSPSASKPTAAHQETQIPIQSIDYIIAKHIEVLQREIDSANASSSSSSSSSPGIPSLVLVAEANNALLDVFPQNDHQVRSVYGVQESENPQGISPVAPMLGLSLITQIINAIKIIKKLSSGNPEPSLSALPSLSSFLPSLKKEDRRAIERILIQSQLEQLISNIERSLSMARHRHKGSGPCIVKEWAGGLLHQAKDLEAWSRGGQSV